DDMNQHCAILTARNLPATGKQLLTAHVDVPDRVLPGQGDECRQSVLGTAGVGEPGLQGAAGPSGQDHGVELPAGFEAADVIKVQRQGAGTGGQVEQLAW